MTRSLLVLLLVGTLGACDRNPPEPSHSQSASSSASSQDWMPGQGSGSAAMPPGHPSVGGGQELPPGHPQINGHVEEGHPSMPSMGSSGSTVGKPGSPLAGGVAWKVPRSFENRPVSSAMRAAQYEIEGAKGKPSATLVVYYFGPGQGGGVQANIDRWVGQFQTPAGSKPKIEKRTVHGLPVSVVDVTGTYQAMQMPGAPSSGPQAAQRLLGAIVEGPKGPVFFKLVGPEPVVSKAASGFDHLIASLHAAKGA